MRIYKRYSDTYFTHLLKSLCRLFRIRHLHFSHNAVYFQPRIFHNLCFSFLLGITAVPREIENNAYAKFCGANKAQYGSSASGALNENGLIHDVIWRHWPSCLVIRGLFLTYYENPDFRLSRGLCTYVQLVCNNTCTFFWIKRWKLAVNQFS